MKIKKTKVIKDSWNSFMMQNAKFCEYDIPYCPTTALTLPIMIITFEEAKSIYRKMMYRGDKYFRHISYVCFYLDDYKFDGLNGIWLNPKKALKILSHFMGIITPDFSTYQDFPEALKIYNTYRMRAFGYWIGECGINVINNVRWGTSETYRYCFSGIPKDSIIAIGTVGGNPRKIVDRKRFNEGFFEMLKILNPHTIIVYGSAKYPCFKVARDKHIQIIEFSSRTADAYQRRKTK